MIKIVDNRTEKKLVKFCDLSMQDIFMIPGVDGIFIKMPSVGTSFKCRPMAARIYPKPIRRAEYYFGLDKCFMVVPLEAELHIIDHKEEAQ